MTQQYSTLSVFVTDCNSLNIINCLHQICPSLNDQNHCVVFLSAKNNKTVKHKEKIKNLIDKHFLSYINNQNLIVVETTKTSATECLKEHAKFIKYNWFICLDSNALYAPKFLDSIISDIDRYTSDGVGLNICSTDQYIILNILSRNNLHEAIDNAKTKIQSNKKSNQIAKDYCASLTGANDTELPKFVNEHNFCLMWLEEKSDVLKSGYSFLYKKNNKVFNINNECHGLIQNMFNDILEILWIVNQKEFVHSYRADENHTYVRIKE